MRSHPLQKDHHKKINKVQYTCIHLKTIIVAKKKLPSTVWTMATHSEKAMMFCKFQILVKKAYMYTIEKILYEYGNSKGKPTK
jgi:hypothetical protein